jgi:hypothetical protein
MPTLEEVAKQPLEQRLGRMSRTAEDLAAAIRGQSEAALVRRPDSKNWAANEVICHLRDIEEVYSQPMGVEVLVFEVRDPTDLDSAISTAARARVGAMLVVGTPMFS